MWRLTDGCSLPRAAACNGGSALQPENLSRSVRTKGFGSDRKDTRVKQEAERQGTLPAPEGAKHWFVSVIKKMCDNPQTNEQGKQARVRQPRIK
jgi:hypothetical protein